MPIPSPTVRIYARKHYLGTIYWFISFCTFLHCVGEAKSAPWMAWLALVLWCAGTYWAIRFWRASRPQLSIDEKGVLDTTLKIGTIPWSEIVHAKFSYWHGQKVVCLEVQATETWRQRLRLSKERRIFESTPPELLCVVLEPRLVKNEEEQTLKLLLEHVSSQTRPLPLETNETSSAKTVVAGSPPTHTTEEGG